MPYDIVVPVHTEAQIRPKLPEQRAAHAIFLAALQTADPTLSQTAHDAHIKPFTQALLEGTAENSLSWRVTLLDDTLFDPFMIGLSQMKPGRLLRWPIKMDLEAVTCRHQGYEELAQTPLSHRYRVRFDTPTTFKQSNRHQPIPEPYRCFQSWWGRWIQFAPSNLAINVAVLDIVQAHVAVSNFSLRSRMWADGNRRVVGAVGQMGMIALERNKLEKHWWQEAAVLAAYAPYCGTGHKTTQGLGVTTMLDGKQS